MADVHSCVSQVLAQVVRKCNFRVAFFIIFLGKLLDRPICGDNGVGRVDKDAETPFYSANAARSTMLIKVKEFGIGRVGWPSHAFLSLFKKDLNVILVFVQRADRYFAVDEIELDDLPLRNFSIIRLSDSFSSAKRDR